MQATNLNRKTKTKRRGKGRTDALKDVMGVEGSFKHEWNFLYKNGEKVGDTMAVAAGGLWIRGPAGSGKNCRRRKKESIGDWWSEDLRLECEAGTEGRSGERRSEGEPFLTNDQPAGGENKTTNWNETTSRGRSRTKTPKGKNEA